MSQQLKFLLPQVASFIKVAIERIHSLENELDGVYQIKAASEKVAETKTHQALLKAAKALESSDWLVGDDEMNEFIKISKEDSTYPLRMLERVCKAADVSQIGNVARAAKISKQAEYDPVMHRAFGTDRSTMLD